MKIDLLILQLAVIFLPGIAWARLDATYAAKAKPSDIEFFTRAFVFGLVIYTVEFIIFSLLGWPFTIIDLADAATKEIVTKEIAHEILWGLGIGAVLSVAWLYIVNYKILTWVLKKIGATKKQGDEDVWYQTFNARNTAVEYVHVRDFANQYVYAGWVNLFSESDKLRELVLLEVIVYNFEGEELYKTPRLYLARSPENIHIEIPQRKPEPEENANDQT